jgi:hypothetical protein
MRQRSLLGAGGLSRVATAALCLEPIRSPNGSARLFAAPLAGLMTATSQIEGGPRRSTMGLSASP